MKNLSLFLILICGICTGQNANKDDYVSKDIHFTVKINLKFPDNSSNALQVSDFESIYYDQAILKLPETYSETGNTNEAGLLCAWRRRRG